MKLKINGIEIECTVDEFEELYVRGLINKNIRPEQFDEFPKLPDDIPPQQYEPLKIDPKETTIMLYGCGMPGTGDIRYGGGNDGPIGGSIGPGPLSGPKTHT